MSSQTCGGFLLLFSFCVTGASAQEAPGHFQLIVPDFFETPFDSGHTVIDLPDRPIRRLRILVLQAFERDISVSGIRVWVNGKGMGNILDGKGVKEGLMLTMDPATLNKRPDELFDPKENTIEILATDKRDRRYYQSWILRSGMGQNSYFAYTGAVSPDDPQGVAPDLILDEPRVPPVLQPGQASVRVTVKGTCASTHPATVIKLNGQPLATVQTSQAPFQQAVEVRRDMKELLLEATDEKHNRRTIVIPVIARQKEMPKSMFNGTRYALIIGISRYGEAKDAPPPVPYAAADAGEMARELEEVAGFRKENIRLLQDDKATLAQVRTGLFDFAAKARADDLLVVYIAGHVLHDPRPGKTDRMYLAPYGTQLSQVDTTTLSFSDLEMLLSRSVKCNHTFLVFDVGHPVEGSWSFPGRSLVNNHLLNLFSDQDGRAILVSGSAGEISRPRSDKQTSSFTFWAVRGLAGEADLNQDRVVTAEELFRFVSEKVRAETTGSQNPRYKLPARNATMAIAEGGGPASAHH